MDLLLAEDDPINLSLVSVILKPLGHKLWVARDGGEALELLSTRTFDLLLFDVMMPVATGLDLARTCRQDPRHRDIPLLLLTALSTRDDLIRGFEAGATDYVAKPFHATELLYRVKAHLQLRSLQVKMEETMNQLNLQMLATEEARALLEAKERQISEANRLLSEANRTLMDMASRDQLTGLLNRRKGWDYMLYEEEKSQRSRHPIGVAVLDLDRFKAVNDELGHEAGDRVLETAAQVLRDTLRATDILIRWGGEEFLAVFPETDGPGTARIAAKMRAAIEVYPWDLADDRKVTVSVGTTVKEPEATWSSAIEAADRALYRAKEGGRNQVASS